MSFEIGALDHAESSVERASMARAHLFPPGWAEPLVLRLKPNVKTVLKENMTLYLVPSVHIPKLTVFAISEAVQVTVTGCELIADTVPVPRCVVSMGRD